MFKQEIQLGYGRYMSASTTNAIIFRSLFYSNTNLSQWLVDSVTLTADEKEGYLLVAEKMCLPTAIAKPS